MLEPIINGILILVTVVFAIISISIKDLNRAIAAFVIFSITLSAAFFLIGAPYVAVFQLLVYAGAVTVLFLAALHTIRRGEPE
jgi:NADH-quinone oxidoreductase subunit J